MVEDIFKSKIIEDRVEKIWERIFKNSNEIIKQSKVHSFLSIQEIPTPNIHDLLVQLKILHIVMDMIIAVGPENGLKYEHTRLILNAKDQLTRMEMVAEALNAGNEDDYNKAIAELERQAVF